MLHNLEFFTGPQCHLCDLADDVLAQSERAQGWQVNKQNIRESHELMHLYSARIPVIKRKDTGAELGWPFTVDDVEAFLS